MVGVKQLTIGYLPHNRYDAADWASKAQMKPPLTSNNLQDTGSQGGS